MEKDNYLKRIGKFTITSVGGETVNAFLPRPLPPSPKLDFEPIYPLMAEAERALGRLDGLSSTLPHTPLFLYMYVKKEAVLSSQIEGTQSSLSDLLLFENSEYPGNSGDDVIEVSNYVAAMNFGLERLREGMPISSRLMREIHTILLRSGRGQEKQPGDFRRSQNWIGGTRPGDAVFVPPPANRVVEYMSDLEKYIHLNDNLPVPVKAALVHVQFETIHPFLDGNGRLGRLLITFMLCANGGLRHSILYLSLYLKTHRQEYYELLQRVRSKGVWEEWIAFFLEGVKETSTQAAQTATEILKLFEDDQSRINGLGRASGSALGVFQSIQSKPVTSATKLAAELHITHKTAMSAIGALEKLGILYELSNRKRDRLYGYQAYLEILNSGTDPIV